MWIYVMMLPSWKKLSSLFWHVIRKKWKMSWNLSYANLVTWVGMIGTKIFKSNGNSVRLGVTRVTCFVHFFSVSRSQSPCNKVTAVYLSGKFLKWQSNIHKLSLIAFKNILVWNKPLLLRHDRSILFSRGTL